MDWGSETRKGERAAQDVLLGMLQAGLLEHSPAGNSRRQWQEHKPQG